MLSLIRMPFVAVSLLLSTSSLPGGFTKKGDINNNTSLVTADKNNSTIISGKYVSWQLEKQGI